MSNNTASQAHDTLSPSERERVYQRNYPFFLADFVLFTIALQLIGPTTVIPDFVRKLTSSEILIGMSGQMFEVGWLLPQLLIARQLVRVERKKWWFIGPNIPVRLLILIFAGLIVLLGAERKAEMLALFLLFYALAALGDGIVGVPWMDLIGSSLDSKRRARMFGYGTALVGVALLGLSRLVRLILSDSGPDFPNNYALLFAVSGVIFVITIPIGLMIRELPGGKAQTHVPTLRDYLPQLGHVLRTDAPYRTMITARVLATLYALAGPFYIGFATEQLNLSSDVAVSNLLLMQTLGSVGSALIYSWWGDRRSLTFIRVALFIGVLQPVLALIASAAGPVPLYGAFLASGVVSGMLGISFLNWVIGYATPEQRPVYSGLFNTMSALGFLFAPLIGGVLVELLGYEAAFIAALVMIGSSLVVSLQDVPRAHQHAA